MSDIADELRAFEGSEALGNGDFSACYRGAAEITRLRASVAELEEALAAAARVLHKAGEQFSEYAKQHTAKGTADGAAKAATNRQWAERCFSAYWAANDTAEGGKDE